MWKLSVKINIFSETSKKILGKRTKSVDFNNSRPNFVIKTLQKCRISKAHNAILRKKTQTYSKRLFPLSPSPFLRYFSEDTPSLLHINSIASPSFRWSIDGVSMEKPKSFIERHSGNIQRQYLSFIFTHKYHMHPFIYNHNMTLIDIYTNIIISIQAERISLSPNPPA